MPRTVLVVLIGTEDSKDKNAYQQLQEAAARGAAAKVGVNVEIVFAAPFDHLLVVRRRLGDASAPPVDAVVVEPGSVSSTALLLKDLQQKAGLVLLNAWTPEIEDYAKSWSKALPFGTISTHHTKVGEIQGEQASARLPAGGHVLCISGPSRSSAAVERMEGFKRTLRKDATLDDTAGGSWTEADGISAFNSWYAIRRTRTIKVDVIAAQNDELGLGARSAIAALANSEHRKLLSAAAILGVDACPGYGRKAVDQGRLTASVTTPANTGEAIRALNAFWATGVPLRLRALTPPSPYPS